MTLEAVPADCYRFTGWTGDATGDATGGAVTIDVYMDGPKTITANFELLYYTLTVDVVGEGDVAVDGAIPASYPAEFTYPCSSLIDLNPQPAPGWAFDHWEGPVVDNQVHIDGDVSVTAVFVSATVTHTKDLPGGWNLVSIPLSPVGVDCPPACWSNEQVTITVSGSGNDEPWFGVSPDASDGAGVEDGPVPPVPPGDYTQAYFLIDSEKFHTDIKAPMACEATKTWTLEIVDYGSAGEVTLSWDVPAITTATLCLQSVILTDDATGTQIDMQTQGTYTYTKESNPDVRSFTITVVCSCPASEVFADDIDPLYLYRWNACTNQYDQLGDGDVVPDQGYWLWVPEGGATVDVTGNPVTEDVERLLPCAGWHQISAPWAYPKNEIRFTDGVDTKTWAEAVAAGWIADVLWWWNPETGQYELQQAIEDPWNGYWIFTFQDTLTMVLLYEHAELTGPMSSLAPMAAQAGEMPPPPPPMPGVGDLTQLDVVNVPNPVKDVHTTTFRVVGPMASSVEAMRVQIFDLAGSLVYQEETSGLELTWHTQNLAGEYLANGVYLYRVQVKVADQWITLQVKKLAICR